MIPRTLLSLLLAASLTLSSCRTEVQTDAPTSTAAEATSTSSEMQLATFGSGCFWCGEAIFEQLRGVSNVQSGYSGGHVNNPTYRQICGKGTGHAEVFQVSFDPRLITYTDLLEVFWKTHDPTTLNSQGNDHGPQYRSVIFHHSDSQKQTASSYLKKLDASGAFRTPIVTEITAFKRLWPAEPEHQDYFRRNGSAGYCQAVIVPKLLKFQAVFSEKIRN